MCACHCDFLFFFFSIYLEIYCHGDVTSHLFLLKSILMLVTKLHCLFIQKIEINESENRKDQCFLKKKTNHIIANKIRVFLQSIL